MAETDVEEEPRDYGRGKIRNARAFSARRFPVKLSQQQWEKRFGIDRFFIILFDDVVRDSISVLDGTFAHLGFPSMTISEADRRIHAGSDLFVKKNSLRINKYDKYSRIILRRGNLLSKQLPHIKIDDLIKLREIYSEDKDYIERRFRKAYIKWSMAPNLEDFVQNLQMNHDIATLANA